MNGESQTSRSVLLVRPAAFGFHAEAARSNAFAREQSGREIADQARAEFDDLSNALGRAGIETVILDDTPEPARPDAVFPNNWVSFHADGTMVLYPMATALRRAERRTEALTALLDAHGFAVRRTIDLSGLEASGQFLEGTGSLILDRPNRRAFAALGPRTSREPLDAFHDATGISIIAFDCADRFGRPIYHTNVMLSLGTRFAVVCADAIAENDRHRVLAELAADEREIIPVDFDQLERFACNILELDGASGPVIALSTTALAAFSSDQRRRLERHGALLPCGIPVIERIGGGSVRCMIADIHLPRG